MALSQWTDCWVEGHMERLEACDVSLKAVQVFLVHDRMHYAMKVGLSGLFCAIAEVIPCDGHGEKHDMKAAVAEAALLQDVETPKGDPWSSGAPLPSYSPYLSAVKV